LFVGDVAEGLPASARNSGFLLLSFFVDVEATLDRLAGLGLGGSPAARHPSDAEWTGSYRDRA
jgi:hypothetical protein